MLRITIKFNAKSPNLNLHPDFSLSASMAKYINWKQSMRPNNLETKFTSLLRHNRRIHCAVIVHVLLPNVILLAVLNVKSEVYFWWHRHAINPEIIASFGTLVSTLCVLLNYGCLSRSPVGCGDRGPHRPPAVSLFNDCRPLQRMSPSSRQIGLCSSCGALKRLFTVKKHWLTSHPTTQKGTPAFSNYHQMVSSNLVAYNYIAQFFVCLFSGRHPSTSLLSLYHLAQICVILTLHWNESKVFGSGLKATLWLEQLWRRTITTEFRVDNVREVL